MRFKPTFATLLTAILALASSSLAAKIEGVYVGTLGKTNVVFKLEKPGGSDLSGMYYYRNHARDIGLNGTLSGSSLTFEERGLFGADVKAKLSLKLEENGFSGSWTDAKSGQSLPVKLHSVRPAELNVIKLPDTPLLRQWKRSEPYEYLRFTLPLQAVRLERMNGKNVQWFLEPRSKMMFFRLTGPLQSGPLQSGPLQSGPLKSGPAKAINDALTDEHFQMASNALQCPNDSEDGFTFDPKIVLYSKRILSVTANVFYDCGGAHPDGYNENLTLDLQTGHVLKLEDLYRFAAVPKGLNLRTEEPFELFSGFAQARAAVLKKLISQEVKSFSENADCKDLYDTEDVFAFITWYLTPQGLIVQPSFPHVAAVCEDDFLLPYAKLKPYIALNSPFR